MSRADTNNNPTNIKVPSGGLEVARQRYNDPNISVDPNPAADGGHFLKFSSPQLGTQATSTLLDNPIYRDSTVDKAMKTWSGGGYGGDIAPQIANKTVSQLTPEEKNMLIQNMSKREGYSGQSTQRTQSTKGQLSHNQLTANIEAMEKQGAGQQEVQGYLDSLKQSSSQMSPSSVGNQPTSQPDAPKLFGSQTLGDLGVGGGRGLLQTIDYASGFGDWLLRNSAGRVINAVNGKGFTAPESTNDLANLVGGQDKLTQLETPTNTTQGIGKFMGMASTAAAAGGGMGLLDSVLGASETGTALGSPAIKNIIASDLGPEEAVSDLTSGDKANILKNVLKTADASEQPIIQKALNELGPKILTENNIGPGKIKAAFQFLSKHPFADYLIYEDGIKPMAKQVIGSMYDKYVGSQLTSPNAGSTTYHAAP